MLRYLQANKHAQLLSPYSFLLNSAEIPVRAVEFPRVILPPPTPSKVLSSSDKQELVCEDLNLYEALSDVGGIVLLALYYLIRVDG